MTDYSKGKIYKIQNKFKPELFYIGSTAQTLNARLRIHKRDSKICNSRLYNVVRNTNGWENYLMILIKDFACNDREELNKEEQLCITALQPTLNTNNAYTNHQEYMKEYYENNKEEYKKYYKNNREEINKKQSVPITCKCGKIYTHGHMARHKKSNIHKKNYLNYFIKNIEKNLLSKSILKWKQTF